MPKSIHLQGLTAHYAIAGLEPRDDARVADATPRRDRNLAMLEGARAYLDERVVIVDVEYEGVLRNYQSLAGAGDDTHLGEHLRLEPGARIFYCAADLKRVRRRIDIRTDAVDHAVEDLIGKGGRNRGQLLTDADACEIVLINVTGDPDVVERSERKQDVTGINGGPPLDLVLDDGAADRRPHPDCRIGRLDCLDVRIGHPEKLQFASGGL